MLYNIVHAMTAAIVYDFLCSLLTYYTPSIKNVGIIAQWHVQVATSAVWPKGQVPATKNVKSISEPIHNHTKKNLLTCAKRYDIRIRGAEQARINAVELAVDDPVQLRVTRRLSAERRRRHDAVDVQRVARVLAVRGSVVDQSLLIVDPRKLSKVHHRVGVVLLRTRVRAREECVEPVYPCQHHAGVVVRVPRSAACFA
jgi:hypothetical protein